GEHRQHSEDVDLEHAARVVERVALDGREDALIAGVVDQAGQRAGGGDRVRHGALVRHVERERFDVGAGCAAFGGGSCERFGTRGLVGEDEARSRECELPRDCSADVARGAGDEDGAHSVTVARLTSAPSKRCTAPWSVRRTFSSGLRSNVGSALATIRRSSPSWSMTRWTKTSEPRSSTSRMRAGIGPASPIAIVSGRKPSVARSPPPGTWPIRISAPAMLMERSIETGSMFIDGEPMNPATNRFAGWW